MGDVGSDRGSEEGAFPLPPPSQGADGPGSASRVPSASALSKKGFVLKKRTRTKVERDAHPSVEDDIKIRGMDFLIENPLDGKFKSTDFIKELLHEHPYTVFQRATSYCHYGLSYRKRTVLFTTMEHFTPTPPCPSKACIDWRVYGSHSCEVAFLAQDQRNSLPDLLIDEEIKAWVASTAWASTRMFIDVFSGFGSVVRRVRETNPDVITYANDIVQREDNDVQLDMRLFGMHGLLTFAVKKHFPDDFDEASAHPGGLVGWLLQNNVALFFHVSCPCETYSTAAGSTHRSRSSAAPMSSKALEHDRMNKKIVGWLMDNCFKGPSQ